MVRVNSGDMGFSVEHTRRSRQQSDSKIVKDSVLSAEEIQSQKYQVQDKLKLKHQVDLSNHRGCERRQNAERGLEQPKSLGKLDPKKTRDDELVKHMSNLPGYLQRVDRRENLQGKALNVGVLEWGRLEKWKHNQSYLPTRSCKDASSYSMNSSVKMTSGSSSFSIGNHNDQSEKDRSTSSIIKSAPNKSLPEVTKQSIRKVINHQHSEAASKNSLDGSKKICRTNKSSGKNNDNIMLDKTKRRDFAKKVTSDRKNLSPDTGNYKHPPGSEKNTSPLNAEANTRVENLQEADIKSWHLDQEITSSGDLLSKLKTNAVSVSSKGKASAMGGQVKARVAELEKSNIDLGHQQCTGEHKNAVLLSPKKFLQSNLSDTSQLSERIISHEENSVEENWSNSSCWFSPEEFHSAELGSDEIPHSCPLPSRIVTNNEPEKMPHGMLNGRGLKLSFDDSQMPSSSSSTQSKQFEDRYAEINKLNINPTNPKSVESIKILDEHAADLAAKGRNSPNRRFSFSRISRSFSLKDGSGIPQFSSTYISVKSGPVGSEASAYLDSSKREKADNVHNRARSSPLRRLLDPLLKSKATNSETIQPVERNLYGFKSINPSESLQNEKHDSSQVQALLQLTVKNGVPLFKFVVNNNTNILAATMKKVDTCRKDVSCQNFTFYSVKENKKKSGGWMSQGNKSKSCGYIYNIIGQMKVSTSLNGENSIRESILYGVEVSPEGQNSLTYPQHRELAAVVVKIPVRNSNSTIVILPGGVHSLPNKGIPSSLIDRWNSGGSCDCGGWDIGCKLRILSNGNRCLTNSGTSIPPLIPDHLQLFDQEGSQQNRLVFSLSSLKNGIYSIEFNASISLLQAFFICIAVTNCQNLSNLTESSNISDVKVVQEPTLNGSDGLKTPVILPGGLPSIYVPNPPNSPVGRV